MPRRCAPDGLAIEATQVALAPGCVAHAPLAGHSTWFFFTRPDRPCKGTAGSGIDRNADEISVGFTPETGDAHPVYDACFTRFNDAYNTGVALWPRCRSRGDRP